MPTTGKSPSRPAFPSIPSPSKQTPDALPTRVRRTPSGNNSDSADGTRKRTPRGPSPQKTEATRLSIIDAAFAEFLEHGYARGTTASAARRAGLSKVTLFRYFESKAALFQAVMQRHIASATLALQASTMEDDETAGAFLLRALAPAMDVLDSSGRAATARLVIAEGLEFPELVKMYLHSTQAPLTEHIRTLAVLALPRGELKEPALLEHPELLLAPVWMAMMNNTVLSPLTPMDAGHLFRMQVRLLFECGPRHSTAAHEQVVASLESS